MIKFHRLTREKNEQRFYQSRQTKEGCSGGRQRPVAEQREKKLGFFLLAVRGRQNRMKEILGKSGREKKKKKKKKTEKRET